MEKVSKIWMDGKFVPWEEANVHILTHTLHYGLGVFEGIRAYECLGGKTSIFRLKEHIERLFDSAKIFWMEVPYSRKELIEASLELFRVNKLKAGYLRPIVYIGDGEMGLHSAAKNPIRVSLICWPWGTYLGDEGVQKGIRAKISSYTRLVGNVNLPKGKTCGNYINSILAKREANFGGYEEAILLDVEGYVAEATGENVFIVKDGIVRTPPLSSSILRGITRDAVLQILADSKIPVKEERISREDAYLADELFLTGTAAEVCPIRELDDHTIGSGKPGPVTKKVQTIFFDAVKGKKPEYKDWLNYV
ncbi:MAG: branched-chain-amino-acid transaminase [Deltaproteobacteria bacterium]|nr:branched-chain-amino-acid transaminase [Deltaproteobacteria bacterium]